MMNKAIRDIKHFFQTKIFHAWMNIEKEREEKKLRDVLASITFHGKPLTVGERFHIHGGQHMEFGDNCSFGSDAWVECIEQWEGQCFTPYIHIGNDFGMQRNCHIGCIHKIEIGDNVLLGSNVYITDHYHGEITKEALAIPPIERLLWGKSVQIGNNVWIGDNVCIMPGVSLGDNIIVGANAVVTHSFPENVVIAGVPAKIIKELK